jgi:hypothetical protein
MKVEIEVLGLKEMERALLKLGPKVGVKVLRAAIRKGAKPMLESAKRWAPYDPSSDDGYHIRDSISIAAEPKKFKTTPAQFRIGPRRIVEAGQVVGGLSPNNPKSPNYAGIVHKEVPFLSIAFDTQYKNFLRIFSTELSKSITKALRKSGQ